MNRFSRELLRFSSVHQETSEGLSGYHENNWCCKLNTRILYFTMIITHTMKYSDKTSTLQDFSSFLGVEPSLAADPRKCVIQELKGISFHTNCA